MLDLCADSQMVDGQDGNNIGLPALVKKLPHENRLRILYTLAFPEEATRAPTHLHLLGPRDEPMVRTLKEVGSQMAQSVYLQQLLFLPTYMMPLLRLINLFVLYATDTGLPTM